MSYLKAAHKIEEASFSKIQEIIDQEHPDIQFSDPFEEAVLKRVVFTSAAAVNRVDSPADDLDMECS